MIIGQNKHILSQFPYQIILTNMLEYLNISYRDGDKSDIWAKEIPNQQTIQILLQY